ncbi:iron-containing alcohol dehydrogenase [Pseudomonas guariconensis]|uniref:Alcohol dehydrogenase iron-type/glycerol dehydrogenase GldA domain-containing protein n=1 Tax=Pseudomonas guariconensis TaxID=1288410 RepID=A0AAX0VTX1_9PSED|nr:iron-containing alcohol dehydrogenase [Pseudomonas guariconensis]PLV17819.1 hypothetical protein CXG49_17685 [Pseudomonas guariconensis]PLV22593.1 hypothetical protein CXG53_18770 [Pseudomonas guariconensis]PLV27616.1 hypothetical protein CXG51_19245 [Pseudomonas guariconensis]
MSLVDNLTSIQFVVGGVSLLPAEYQQIGITLPLIVTDRGARRAGNVDGELSTDTDPSVHSLTYHAPSPNPSENAVREAVAMFKKCGCDRIIAIGGASGIHFARGLAVCAKHEGPLESFAFLEGGLAGITPAAAPLIGLPTTTGTISEVGRGAFLILDNGRKVKGISAHDDVDRHPRDYPGSRRLPRARANHRRPAATAVFGGCTNSNHTQLFIASALRGNAVNSV